MNFDFSALLVFLTFASGIIWGLDALFFAPGRKQVIDNTNTGEHSPEHEPVWVEYARSFFPVFLIVLILRSFIVEPFRIPSGSMMPNLLIGDFILVNKYEYGIRLPVLHTKIFENKTPERGDIAVFRYPEDLKTPYIKRVIGLPGDQVIYTEDKQLYINGRHIKQTPKGIYKSRDAATNTTEVLLHEEFLYEPEHDILINPWSPARKAAVMVPDGHYFVMGDNRDNSTDSRFWGFVPDENLMGRAFFIWMHWRDWSIQWRRIGTILK